MMPEGFAIGSAEYNEYAFAVLVSGFVSVRESDSCPPQKTKFEVNNYGCNYRAEVGDDICGPVIRALRGRADSTCAGVFERSGVYRRLGRDDVDRVSDSGDNCVQIPLTGAETGSAEAVYAVTGSSATISYFLVS